MQSPGHNLSGEDVPNLTERQQTILSLIVREHIRSGEPVGSKTLVEDSTLNVSSATVRNDMGVLEELGLVYAPHTSAGRVPTQQGYRHFVHWLLRSGTASLALAERRQIAHQFEQAPLDMEEWMRIAAEVLSRSAQTAALITSPSTVENHFKHLELISTQGRLVLMVLVLQGGSVHQQLLTLAEPVTQDVLSQVAQIINMNCAGMNADSIRTWTRGLSDALAAEVGELVVDAMNQSNRQGVYDVYRHGLSESLTMFSGVAASQAVRVMEERSVLDGVLREMIMTSDEDVLVLVAGEGRWESLSQLSMVLGRYGTSYAFGALGVVGPTRMRYGRAISTVRYVARLMSGMLGAIYGEVD